MFKPNGMLSLYQRKRRADTQVRCFSEWTTGTFSLNLLSPVFIFHTAASMCSWCVAVTCDLIYRVETQTCSLQVNLIPLLQKNLQRHFFLCFVSWRETWYCFTVTWWRDQGPQQLCSAPGTPLYVNQALQVHLKTDVKEEIIQTQKYGFFLRSQNAVRG